MKRWWSSVKSDWDRSMIAMALALYSFIYGSAAVFDFDRLGPAVQPLTGLAIVYSWVLIIASVIKVAALVSVRNRARSLTSLAFFFIWTTTGLIYLGKGDFFLFMTVTLTPIIMSVCLSLRNNTTLFDRKS